MWQCLSSGYHRAYHTASASCLFPLSSLKVSPATEILRWYMFLWVTSNLLCSSPKMLSPIEAWKESFGLCLENSFGYHLLWHSSSWTPYSSPGFWKAQTQFPSCANQETAPFRGRLEMRPIVHLHCVTFPQLKRKKCPLKCAGWKLCFLPLGRGSGDSW